MFVFSHVVAPRNVAPPDMAAANGSLVAKYVPAPTTPAATAPIDKTTVLRKVSSGGGFFFCAATMTGPNRSEKRRSSLRGRQATFYRGTVQTPADQSLTPRKYRPQTAFPS
jgi:hypothetical protein